MTDAIEKIKYKRDKKSRMMRKYYNMEDEMQTNFELKSERIPIDQSCIINQIYNNSIERNYIQKKYNIHGIGSKLTKDSEVYIQDQREV